MSIALTLDQFVEYTEWERSRWRDWFRQQGDQPLAISVGPHGDGRFQTVGDVVRHIFSAERRYVERLSKLALTDASSIPNDSVAALFEFGRQSREELKQFIHTYPAHEWDIPQEFTLMNNSLTATSRKIIVHVLMHEIRHWAQIATLFRLSGLKCELHDFLFSPVLGGEFKRAAS